MKSIARKAILKETIRANTIRDMKKLGTYKSEYDRVIGIYSELIEQYERLQKEFSDSKYEYKIETMQGGEKKSPLVGTLESLRKDILMYSDRLCLNPKAMDKGGVREGNKKQSKLAAALAKHG